MRKQNYFRKWSLIIALFSLVSVDISRVLAETMDPEDIEKYKNLMSGAQRRLEQKNYSGAEKNCADALNFASRFDDESSKTGAIICLAQIFEAQAKPESACEYWIKATASGDLSLQQSKTGLARASVDLAALKATPPGSDALRDRKIEVKQTMIEFTENEIKSKALFIDQIRVKSQACKK